ncbi:DUF4838 domain-containing protein [Candidatus Omnitrophota bacterium]
MVAFSGNLLRHVMMYILLLLLVYAINGCGNKESFELVHNGKSPYAIVLTGKASPSETYAADELRHFIKLATEAELPIVDENDPRAKEPLRIFIGAGDLVNSEFGIQNSELGEEGFIIRTVPGEGPTPDIIIAGAQRRGTLYGVYTFLDHLGYRWYTNRKTWLPHEITHAHARVRNSKQGTLRFPPFDEKVIPSFSYREPWIAEAFDDDWAPRIRVNLGHGHVLDEAHGGSTRINGGHTFNFLMPTSLFREHPEYFPLIGGKRVNGYVQRCLTAPGLVEVAAENMIKWMDSKPNEKIFSLAQADVEMLCECPNCVKKMEDEGSPSGLYLDFVNKVAEIVETKHPDKYVITFAYWFTEKPPKTVKPRHNVIIRLCPISICEAHSFTECSDPKSVEFYEHLKGWSKLANNISIWHYNIDFNNLLMPFPNFKEFTLDIKNYLEHNVKGIFFQGSGHCPGLAESDLRAWTMARLLWDPYLDPEEVINEWMHNVYGSAYEPMRANFDLIHSRVTDPDKHLHVFIPVTKEMWPDNVVASMDSLHKEALTLAQGDETATYYINKNYSTVKFLQFVLNSGRLEVQNGKYVPVDNTMTETDHDRLMEHVKQFGVTFFREEWGDSNFITILRQRVETHDVVTIENDDIQVDVVPRLGGRIVRLIHKKTGTDVINQLDRRDNFYPIAGGYEEMTTRTWGCTGFSNNYEVEVKGRTMQLTAKTPKGLLFKRTLSLPARGAKINFTSNIINENNTPTTYRLVCRMALNGEYNSIKVKARNKVGSFVEPSASEESEDFVDKTVRKRYSGPNKPAGAWRMESLINGLTVVNTFPAGRIENCQLNISEKTQMVRMEIQTPEREVKPGDKITVKHSWEIIK